MCDRPTAQLEMNPSDYTNPKRPFLEQASFGEILSDCQTPPVLSSSKQNTLPSILFLNYPCSIRVIRG